MEPYVIHWLDGIERDFRQSRKPVKADYVYFLPRISSHRWDSIGVEALHSGTVITSFPSVTMCEERKVSLMEASRDLKELVNSVWQLPKKLFNNWIYIDSTDTYHTTNPQKGAKWAQESQEVSNQSQDVKDAVPHESILASKSGRQASISELSPLYINPNRLAYSRCARVIAEISPPIWTARPKGLMDIFKEADMRHYVNRAQR